MLWKPGLHQYMGISENQPKVSHTIPEPVPQQAGGANYNKMKSTFWYNRCKIGLPFYKTKQSIRIVQLTSTKWRTRSPLHIGVHKYSFYCYDWLTTHVNIESPGPCFSEWKYTFGSGSLRWIYFRDHSECSENSESTPKPPEIFLESVNLQAALADHGSQIKAFIVKYVLNFHKLKIVCKPVLSWFFSM